MPTVVQLVLLFSHWTPFVGYFGHENVYLQYVGHILKMRWWFDHNASKFVQISLNLIPGKTKLEMIHADCSSLENQTHILGENIMAAGCLTIYLNVKVRMNNLDFF